MSLLTSSWLIVLGVVVLALINGYPIEINAVTIIGDVLFAICVIMTIVSGIDYLIKGKQYLKG